MDVMRELKEIYSKDEVRFYEYKPSFIHPLFDNMDCISFTRRCRLWLDLFCKGSYKVYYLSVNGELVGYGVLAPGGRRLKCSTPSDIVSGPTFIKPEHRGKGYGTIIKKLQLKYCCNGYDRMLCWISKSNIASLRMCEKSGFKIIGSLNVVGKFRRLMECPDLGGSNLILSYNLMKQQQK